MSISSSATFKDFLRSSLKWAYKRQRPDDHMFKNDDVELERQLIHHWTMQQGFGRLTGTFIYFDLCVMPATNSMVTAPVNDILKGPGAKVLDIGCACGVWVMVSKSKVREEMASAYPNATVIGLDNDSYVLPNNTMPKNAKFDLVDILHEKLPYPDCSFDLVFVSIALSFISCPHLI
ncbi:hypothetical protein BC936DRAFT_146441 [Jimgerdemannia flammicorona]|uniref:Methyltransferase type 11 domain-containing protein n=1 Tax=Jimgerdemannia flammicorona TaxID=994334 RepID=A0A433D7Q3_9FUNG|nr:hypothetical protein BC936DRAFT_146441 [Jimgerdemannia flammicorona]